MSGIKAEDFARFFEAIYEYRPFPWQVRLAAQVCDTGRFPSVIDLPTGTGKTACVDIALFHLAHDLANAGPRNAPLRIAWVVDRRLIVDDVYERAALIAKKLIDATDGILREVADVYREIAGYGEPPLVVKRLRGGIPREGDWARTPTQPTVVSSTVDQVGSRLLFRGYGVRDTMRPIQAGLLGEDTLIVLDEVHLSEPFRQTLARIASYRRNNGTWNFVQLSATPRMSEESEKPFGLDESDAVNAVLQRRLGASKPATLLRLGRLKFGSEEHADRFASEAISRAAFDDFAGPKKVLIVVNRVELARRVHEKIEDRLRRDGRQATVTRLVGRGRDIEKAIISKQVVDHCKSEPSGKSREKDIRPFFVVATQTIEAGADLDFDALVTQIAPLDALRQRFGRLNRMGREIDAVAAILAVDAEIATSAKADPVYEFASRETWNWLETKAREGSAAVDFATGFLKVDPTEAQPLQSPSHDAPVLMPEHLKAFSRTSPVPAWSPDASLYLHGSPNSPADVNIVWRADLPIGFDRSTVDDAAGKVTRILGIVPPRMGEVVAMPVGVVRRWLRGEQLADAADLEIDISARDESQANGHDKGLKRTAWRWFGADRDAEFVRDGNVRPGDTIVVSSPVGGCDRFGWNPTGGVVDDVAAEASAPFSRRSYAVRLHRKLIEQELRRTAGDGEAETTIFGARVAQQWKAIAATIVDNSDSAAQLLDALLGSETQNGISLPTVFREALLLLRRPRGHVSLEFAYGDSDEDDGATGGVIIFAKHGIRDAPADEFESATEGDGVGSLGSTDTGQSLVEHSEAVRRYAGAFAKRLNLPEALADDLALSGYLHDVGKADVRFQRYLAGNCWAGSMILAKSGKRRSSRENAAARKVAGLAPEWRHEALSVRIAREHPDFAHAHDVELVLWLIGTHHGYGRPRYPHAEPLDDAPSSYKGFTPFTNAALVVAPSAGPQRVDFILQVATAAGVSAVDWSMMFARLEERYGIWGLARMESIVRLADHRASEVANVKSEVRV